MFEGHKTLPVTFRRNPRYHRITLQVCSSPAPLLTGSSSFPDLCTELQEFSGCSLQLPPASLGLVLCLIFPSNDTVTAALMCDPRVAGRCHSVGVSAMYTRDQEKKSEIRRCRPLSSPGKALLYLSPVLFSLLAFFFF